MKLIRNIYDPTILSNEVRLDTIDEIMTTITTSYVKQN